MQIGDLIIHDGKNIPSGPDKDADSDEWYGFEYQLADGETIQSSSWLINDIGVIDGAEIAGLEFVEGDFSGNVCKARIRGGVRGREYILTNQFSTNLTPKDHRSMYVLVTDL